MVRIQPIGTLGTPAYRQIYERVKNAILSGNLPPGTRLPSTRSLASQISMARGTVELAYDLLAGEGYVVGHGAAGTFVDPQLDRHMNAPPGPTPSAKIETREDDWDLSRQTPPRPFQMGLPALDAFPRKLWSRLAPRASPRAAPTAWRLQR